MKGPCDGDLVRATEDSLDGAVIEGILRLRHVPWADYVQVLVDHDRGGTVVRPDSIEVITEQVEPMSDVELDDPLRFDEGWRRYLSLDEAQTDGLIRRPVVPEGVTEASMHALLTLLCQPLVDAGWVVTELGTWTDPDEVVAHCVLERDGVLVEVQYCCTDDAVRLYPGGPSADIDEPTEPLEWSLRPTVEECTKGFERVGWIPTAPDHTS